jgi:hypothetical protein
MQQITNNKHLLDMSATQSMRLRQCDVTVQLVEARLNSVHEWKKYTRCQHHNTWQPSAMCAGLPPVTILAYLEEGGSQRLLDVPDSECVARHIDALDSHMEEVHRRIKDDCERYRVRQLNKSNPTKSGGLRVKLVYVAETSSVSCTAGAQRYAMREPVAYTRL